MRGNSRKAVSLDPIAGAAAVENAIVRVGWTVDRMSVFKVLFHNKAGGLLLHY